MQDPCAAFGPGAGLAMALALLWALLALARVVVARQRHVKKPGQGPTLTDLYPWLPLLALGLLALLPEAAADARAALAGSYFAWWSAGRDPSAHSLVLLAVASLWALRLSGYLAARYLPHGEEARYAKWRQSSGAGWWWWSYFQIFLTQGVLVWLWALTLFFAAHNRGELGWTGTLALLVWLAGFLFEAGGDLQMSRFRRDPANRGKVMDRGLWACSRHPNYFGEALTWLSFFLFALGTPWGWLSGFSVVMVFWFMNQGSATSMTERYMLKSKPGYADYMARTPAFWPHWPR